MNDSQSQNYKNSNEFVRCCPPLCGKLFHVSSCHILPRLYLEESRGVGGIGGVMVPKISPKNGKDIDVTLFFCYNTKLGL